jgi:hypothetical protein
VWVSTNTIPSPGICDNSWSPILFSNSKKIDVPIDEDC